MKPRLGISSPQMSLEDASVEIKTLREKAIMNVWGEMEIYQMVKLVSHLIILSPKILVNQHPLPALRVSW